METTDYSGMFIYKDYHLDHILTSEGRLKWDVEDEMFYAEYFIKDHLGNVRSVITSHPESHLTIQGTDYYPFGLEIPVYGDNDNQLKYNSKELQTEADLSWYDYGARFYDPVIGRWHVVDPMAEKSRRWSPYTYCMNNPIRFIDPDGMEVGDFINEQGKYVGNDGKNDGRVYVIKTSKTSFDSGVKSAGISSEDALNTENFIANNSGNTEAFNDNNIAYENSVEIEGNANTRGEMVKIINQDDGTGGTNPENSREHGGMVDFAGKVSAVPSGTPADPSVDHFAEIAFPGGTILNKTEFHSHPSVAGVDENGQPIGFMQAPSSYDIQNAGTSTGVKYVFGRRGDTKTTYMYNSTGVIATIPTNSFVFQKR